MLDKDSAESVVRQIRRNTRRKCSAEEKIRIVQEGPRGQDSIAEPYRRKGINPNLYHKWSKGFLEAGMRRLAGRIRREPTSSGARNLLGIDFGKCVETGITPVINMGIACRRPGCRQMGPLHHLNIKSIKSEE